jgi:AraC-like DNA-binding protein
MKPIPRPLLVLHPDRRFREQLRAAAARSGLELCLVSSWEVLGEELRIAAASALVVVDPYVETEPRRGPSVELASLMNRFPSATVIAAMQPGPGRLEHVRRLGEWGIVQIIDLDEELSAVAIAQRLQGARGRPLRSLIERSLPAYTSGPARAILAAAVAVVSEGAQSTELARSLHITPRTLLRWCRRARLPAPRRLLAWVRVLHACELLDDPGRTVSDVALSCGYAADSSLRHAIRGRVGSTPTELRLSGAFRRASEAFLRELSTARHPSTRYRVPAGEASQERARDRDSPARTTSTGTPSGR